MAKTKQQRRKRANRNWRLTGEVLAAVKQHQPDLFDAKDPSPLAIGVHKQIIAAFPDLKPCAVTQFLRIWTRREPYRKALAADGGHRFDLSGVDAGEVSESDRQHAIEMLAKREACFDNDDMEGDR